MLLLEVSTVSLLKLVDVLGIFLLLFRKIQPLTSRGHQSIAELGDQLSELLVRMQCLESRRLQSPGLTQSVCILFVVAVARPVVVFGHQSFETRCERLAMHHVNLAVQSLGNPQNRPTGRRDSGPAFSSFADSDSHRIDRLGSLQKLVLDCLLRRISARCFTSDQQLSRRRLMTRGLGGEIVYDLQGLVKDRVLVNLSQSEKIGKV